MQHRNVMARIGTTMNGDVISMTKTLAFSLARRLRRGLGKRILDRSKLFHVEQFGIFSLRIGSELFRGGSKLARFAAGNCSTWNNLGRKYVGSGTGINLKFQLFHEEHFWKRPRRDFPVKFFCCKCLPFHGLRLNGIRAFCVLTTLTSGIRKGLNAEMSSKRWQLAKDAEFVMHRMESQKQMPGIWEIPGMFAL